MRIALDCRAAFPGMGGIGRYAWSLLEEYASLELRDEFVCYFTHLEPPEPLRLPRNFMIRTFQAGMIDERFDQFVLPGVLRHDRIDVYHNPTFAVPVIKDGTRSISTIHDVVFRRHPALVEPKLRRYLDLATRRACKSADALVTVSEFSKSEIVALYGVAPERITVIPNGVRMPAQAAPRSNDAIQLRELGLEPGRYALYVGSIEPKKNIDYLLRGFHAAAARSAAPDLKLALAGSRGSEAYSLDDRIAELGLGTSVRALGYVREELLEVLYRHALLFVYPSLYEGFGLPPLEAMTRGVPTVVARCSSLPEVVGDDAILVDPTQAENLAEAILKLVDDSSLRATLSRQGKARASRFTWLRSAEEHLKLIRSIVGVHENTALGV